MNTFINGPVNFVRLSDGQKTLDLLFDIHVPVHHQTWCNHKGSSKDIHEYLNELFQKQTETLDFFIEGNPSFMEKDSSFERDTYMKTTQQWAIQHMKGSHFTNVRFHYMDIRNDISSNDMTTLQPSDVCDVAEEFRVLLLTIQDILRHKGHTIPNKKSHRQRYILYKLIRKYTNKEIEKKLNIIIKENIMKHITKTIDFYEQKSPKIERMASRLETNDMGRFDEISYGIRFYKRKTYEYKIEMFAHELFTNWIDILLKTTDMFFLRRFLDKAYIEHAILYAGGFHCVHVLFLLIKYFNFRITHSFFCLLPHQEIMDMIRKQSSTCDINLYLKYFYPTRLRQCINLNTQSLFIIE